MEMETRTYLFIHLIWCTTDRKPLLKKPLLKVLIGYLHGWSEKNLARIIHINGVADHLHCLIQLHPTLSLSQIVRSMKDDSAKWIGENKITEEEFAWEDGYIAYSVSPSSIAQVGEYIDRQEKHHLTRTLDSELESLEKIRI